MCPSSGADDCVVLSPRVDIAPWLQEWTHDLPKGSDSPPAATAQYHTRGDNTTQSSAPEDGHIVARNTLKNL